MGLIKQTFQKKGWDKMLIGIDSNETFDFVYSKDDQKNPTTFVCGVMLKEHQGNLFKGCMNPDGSINYNNLTDLEKIHNVVKSCLRKIVNYQIGKSVPMTYEGEMITEAVINSIPLEVKAEMMGKIIEHNFPTGEEEKK